MKKIIKQSKKCNLVGHGRFLRKHMFGHEKRQSLTRATSSTESKKHCREMDIDLEALTYYPSQDVEDSRDNRTNEPSDSKAMQYNDGRHTSSRNKRDLEDIDLLVLAALHVDDNENVDVCQNAIGRMSRYERHAAV